MSSVIHKTFGSMTQTDFEEYALTLVRRYPNSDQRKQAVAFLQNISSTDKIALDVERSLLRAKRVAQRKKQTALDALITDQTFDFNRQPTLFQAQATSDASILTLLTQNNNEVFITHDMTADVTISGNNVLFDGGSNEKSARTGELVNQATITGLLKISGDNITIRGVNFISTAEMALEITGNSSGLHLENCTFTAPSGHTDSKWFYGNLGRYSGDLTITNCKVSGFTSWMLADFSTTSAAATSALGNVRISKNYFSANKGSMAARGQISDPMKLYSFTDNKIEVSEFHASHWDVHEASGALLKAVCTGNTYTGPVGADTDVTSKKGFFQCWSKSSRPWYTVYKDNVLTNVRCGGKIAHNAGFYAPDQFNENSLVDISSTHTAVYKAFSQLYKKADGTTPSASKWLLNDAAYTPENIVTYPNVVPIVNPSGYSVVQPV